MKLVHSQETLVTQSSSVGQPTPTVPLRKDEPVSPQQGLHSIREAFEADLA